MNQQFIELTFKDLEQLLVDQLPKKLSELIADNFGVHVTFDVSSSLTEEGRALQLQSDKNLVVSTGLFNKSLSYVHLKTYDISLHRLFTSDGRVSKWVPICLTLRFTLKDGGHNGMSFYVLGDSDTIWFDLIDQTIIYNKDYLRIRYSI